MEENSITAETGSGKLIFSLTCIDYNVKDSKSIHLNVPLEGKKKNLSVQWNIANLDGKNPGPSLLLNAWMHTVPIKEYCLDINNKNKEDKKYISNVSCFGNIFIKAYNEFRNYLKFSLQNFLTAFTISPTLFLHPLFCVAGL